MNELARSKNRIVAGVIGGFAEWLNINPTVLRIVSLVTALLFMIVGFFYYHLFGAAAVLLTLIFMYFLLAIILPERSNLKMENKLENKTVTNKAEKKKRNYVGIVRRGFAFIIDLILFSLLVLIAGILFLGSRGAYDIVFFILLEFILFMVVFFVPTLKSGQTLGKYILSIKIVDRNGKLPKAEKLFLREFVKSLILFLSDYLFLIPLILSAFLIWYDKNNQSLHDKAADTYIISAK
ncbi:MAG: RDD family protein [Candidatus Micrarchaeia archaeon]